LCGWTDFNRDGWPDLYVVNDFRAEESLPQQWQQNFLLTLLRKWALKMSARA